MVQSVRDVAFKAGMNYVDKNTTRGKWMQTWPGMLVLNCSQLWWTQEMEESMNAHGHKGIEAELEKQIGQLREMTKLVQGKLAKLARTSIGALTVIDVHAR